MEDNNPKQDKSDIIKEGFDIWQEILSESTTKKDIEEANIFVFGDKSTGKKSLIKIMNKDAESSENETKKTLNIEEGCMKYGLMNFSHLTVKKI